MTRFASPAIAVFVTLSAFPAGVPASTAPPSDVPGPAAERDPAVAPLDELLGFPVAERSATFEEIGRALEAWSSQPRARVVEHGRTWEGRPLRHLIVTSPRNLERIEEIRADWERVASDDTLSSADAAALAARLPGVAWLAFSIHGDEVSGADAALQIADHLIASRAPEVESMLADLVVILDPIQNPDGRERYLARVRETAGAVPVRDSQSIQQEGSWPWGRTNHYLFDMNRDWVFATQPESRARIAALSRWRPLLFLDVHEMGADSPFLFYPPRPPFNPYLPAQAARWWERFGRDEAAAFDRHGWRYYTGEWADWWFPGYSDSFGTLRGAIGILHEQGGVASGDLRLENGQLIGYAESVAHQVTAAWATLRTLAANRAEIAADFARERRRARAPGGPLANRTLAIVPNGNATRLVSFFDSVSRLGGRVERLDRPLRVEARDPLARRRAIELPAGALLVRGRQPEGALLRATLDFDLPLPREILEKEREAIVTGKDTLLYDISGWSLPLLFGLDAYEIDGELAGAPASPLTSYRAPAPVATPAGGDAVGWALDGADDASVAVAVRLMEAGVRLRLAERPFEIEGRKFERGSVIALRDDNRQRSAELAADVARAADGLSVPAFALSTGYGASELPDLGGAHFLSLERPRVALVGYGTADATSFGALWHELDRGLGISASMLSKDDLGRVDLRRYNVLVLAGGVEPDESAQTKLRAWAEAGGTLIAVESAAVSLAHAKSALTATRSLAEAGDDLALFRDDLIAEWGDSSSRERALAIDRALASEAAPRAGAVAPGLPEPPKKEDRARLQARAARFRSQGTLLGGRIDTKHWLTVGTGPMLPVFTAGSGVLLARSPAEAPVRYGVPVPATAKGAAASPGAAGEPAKSPAWRSFGWSAVPSSEELVLRLSGLLWPEAAEQLANSAYLVREAAGAGQVILFAGDPVWRGAARGTARLFANAVVYGPGCGARGLVIP